LPLQREKREREEREGEKNQRNSPSGEFIVWGIFSPP